MGILGKIRALAVTDEKAWNPRLWSLYGAQSPSGENVDEYTALTYSAVYNAITLISGTIGALPCHLMQRKGDKKRIADDRRMYRVLHDEFNPYMSAMAGRECLVAHALAWGNGYAEIVRNSFGELIELWPITPDRISPEMKNDRLLYRIRMGNEPDVFLPREKVLHVPGAGFDGFTGYSVISMARKSIGLGMALETFGSLYFGQGTHPGVVVSHPGKLSDVANTHLKTSLTEGYSGLGKSHRLLLLEEGMKLEKLGIPPNDSQFLESRAFQIPEIARFFNIPPHKLKDLTKSSFSNIESEQQSFYGDTILPWLVRFEQNFNQQLLSDSDKEYSGRGRLYFKHNAEGILRADTAARAAYYNSMFMIGALSDNEIRAYEDKDPIPGGDEHFVPLNMVPLSMVKEQFREQLKKKLESPGTPALPPKKNGEDMDENMSGKKTAKALPPSPPITLNVNVDAKPAASKKITFDRDASGKVTGEIIDG